MDSKGGLLELRPSDLKFTLDSKTQLSCSLPVSNKSDSTVAFKFTTTNPKKYCVKSNVGILMPRSRREITVKLHAQRETPSDMQCMDKFVIKCVVVKEHVIEKDIAKEMLANSSENALDEKKLMVLFVSPTPPPASPVPERICALELLPAAREGLEMDSKRLLEVYPSDLKFPFELNKQIPCSLQLRNKSDVMVAFKIMSTSSKMYCITMNGGIVMPRSTRDVTVIMKAQKEPLSDMMQCKDEFFIIKSGVVNESLIENVITKEMLENFSGNAFDQANLRVRIVPQTSLPASKADTDAAKQEKTLEAKEAKTTQNSEYTAYSQSFPQIKVNSGRFQYKTTVFGMPRQLVATVRVHVNTDDSVNQKTPRVKADVNTSRVKTLFESNSTNYQLGPFW